MHHISFKKLTPRTREIYGLVEQFARACFFQIALETTLLSVIIFVTYIFYMQYFGIFVYVILFLNCSNCIAFI